MSGVSRAATPRISWFARHQATTNPRVRCRRALVALYTSKRVRGTQIKKITSQHPDARRPCFCAHAILNTIAHQTEAFGRCRRRRRGRRSFNCRNWFLCSACGGGGGVDTERKERAWFVAGPLAALSVCDPCARMQIASRIFCARKIYRVHTYIWRTLTNPCLCSCFVVGFISRAYWFVLRNIIR